MIEGNKTFIPHLDSLFTMELPDEFFKETEDITRKGIIGIMCMAMKHRTMWHISATLPISHENTGKHTHNYEKAIQGFC